MSVPNRTPLVRAGSTRRIARMLGAWLLAWVWAAEAQEPSCADAAPGSPASYPLAMAVQAQESDPPTIVRRRWNRVPPEQVRLAREPQGWAVIRAGFMDSEYGGSNDFVLGTKMLGSVAPYVRLGASVDWQHRSTATSVEIPVTGGSTRYTASEVDMDLIPMMGLMEFHFPTSGLRPYFGFGAGYEWLVVDVKDYQNGYFYEDDFGGFGWQAYGGLNIRLAPNLELGGEAYWNDSTVGREIYDPYYGVLFREELDVDGVGFRGGLSFGF